MEKRYQFYRRSIVRSIATWLFCSLAASKSAAQAMSEYVPFVEVGKVWYCGFWHPNERYPITPEDPYGFGIDCIFTIQGDTLIGQQKYNRVMCVFEDYYGDHEQHYYCAVREEMRHVFIVEEETAEEKLLYDFSNPDKTVYFPHEGTILARTKGWHHDFFPEGQLVYGLCRLLDNELDYSHNTSIWADGIGAPNCNPFSFEFLEDESKLDNRLEVITCMKDETYIYKHEWSVEPPPDAVESTHTTSEYMPPKLPHLSDLQGRRLTARPRHGLYIREGRKYVAR